MSFYPHLLAPLPLRSLTLRNRIVMGAMHTRLETLDRPLERLAAFYGERARGEVGLILTGGYSPNPAGLMEPGAPLLCDEAQLEEHHAIVGAVHAAGGAIALQILHAGRYARHAPCVGASDRRARINAFAPRALSTAEAWQTIDDFARTAELARKAGYDGVEVMGSEGYLLNQFTAQVTNLRSDEFGGSLEARLRFPVEVVKAIRARVGADFLIIYRISAVDLVDGGMTGPEVATLARLVEGASADVINTGIGWHEAPVPTIAASVPRAAWSFAVANVKRAVGIPVIASNRFNAPETAEAVLAEGMADLISMARPLLADPEFARKARQGRASEINTCIACNQACLDRIFTERAASCLVNPRAGREIEFSARRASPPKRIAVVGGGPAGMAFAVHARERGHRVVLFEAAPELGGQLNMARVVPGKREFDETLRYFRARLSALEVELRLGAPASAPQLAAAGFDEIILATGVRPRAAGIAGDDHSSVLSYVDVLAHGKPVGERVAIIGAGGIGFDVAEFLVGDAQESTSVPAFLHAWNIDATLAASGGVVAPAARAAPRRQISLFQRKAESLGKRLGKSTGWILKARLARAKVSMISGSSYERIDDQGLHYVAGGERHTLAVDHVIICAGQDSERSLYDELVQLGARARLIGGADVAHELDAVRAIDQATRLAATI